MKTILQSVGWFYVLNTFLSVFLLSIDFDATQLTVSNPGVLIVGAIALPIALLALVSIGAMGFVAFQAPIRDVRTYAAVTVAVMLVIAVSNFLEIDDVQRLILFGVLLSVIVTALSFHCARLLEEAEAGRRRY